jgi:hypothetical protein
VIDSKFFPLFPKLPLGNAILTQALLGFPGAGGNNYNSVFHGKAGALP